MFCSLIDDTITDPNYLCYSIYKNDTNKDYKNFNFQCNTFKENFNKWFTKNFQKFDLLISICHLKSLIHNVIVIIISINKFYNILIKDESKSSDWLQINRKSFFFPSIVFL